MNPYTMKRGLADSVLPVAGREVKTGKLQPEPALDYRGLIAAVEKVETIRGELHWHDWERGSGRQEQTMLMGGLMGSIVYQGQIAPFLPLLELSRELHLGKQASFGLGKIDFSSRVEQSPCQ